MGSASLRPQAHMDLETLRREGQRQGKGRGLALPLVLGIRDSHTLLEIVTVSHLVKREGSKSTITFQEGFDSPDGVRRCLPLTQVWDMRLPL